MTVMKKKTGTNKSRSGTIVDAAVLQIGRGVLRICWETNDPGGEAVIYHGKSPDAIDRRTPVAVSEDGCVDIDWLTPHARHYFEIVSGKSRMIVAERRVPLDGTVNFRDLGGYRTHDGRRVRWGRVFRADGLGKLTERDRALLREMDVRRIVDFRTDSEIANSPDRLPADDAVWIHLPVTHGKYDFGEAVKRFREGDTEWLNPDFMMDGYIGNIESFAHAWERVVLELLDPEGGPLVFHCTGGKDRTGTCAALILLAVGVPEETVIDDHQLSNIYITQLLPELHRLMSGQGIDPDRVFPYLTAPRDCIEGVIEHIRTRYGSAAGYFLERTDLAEEDLARLGDILLES